MNHSPELDFTSPAFKANPYPTFTQLQKHDPFHRIRLHDGRAALLVTRYKDADAILRDERFVKDLCNVLTPAEFAQVHRALPRQAMNTLHQHMLNSDPPEHTRLRALISDTFTPRLVEQWRGRVQEIADELINTVEEKGQMDLLSQFAFPLSATVILEMLGVPDADHKKFRAWSKLAVEETNNPEAFRGIGAHQYLLELIEEKRKMPANDLLSKLLRIEAQGDNFSRGELVSMVYLLLVAGYETTSNLIGNGTLALLEHPDQMHLLRENPALTKTAVEEFLRYRGPFLMGAQRWAREDLNFGGKHLHRGSHVVIALSAANRDGERFADPERLNITRQENHHLAFSRGIHYCLGAHLARLECQVAINTLLNRLPRLRSNAELRSLTWRAGPLIVGLNELPVAF